jgi:hypothetical protein
VAVGAIAGVGTTAEGVAAAGVAGRVTAPFTTLRDDSPSPVTTSIERARRASPTTSYATRTGMSFQRSPKPP